MRYISLCSGVEAASLAWLPLGWEPVAYAELEDFPSAVLAAKFPDTPNLGDVTKVNWKEYHGAADLVIFGSPCQSYSIAGLREGLADPRGQLMLECLAACRDIDPEWVLFENVPGLLSSDRGRSFETFLNAVAILWPRGGAPLGGFWTRNGLESPSVVDVCSLSSTLETGDVPQRYYLTKTACEGILRRAAKRGKPLPPKLLEALERQAGMVA